MHIITNSKVFDIIYLIIPTSQFILFFLCFSVSDQGIASCFTVFVYLYFTLIHE